MTNILPASSDTNAPSGEMDGTLLEKRPSDAVQTELTLEKTLVGLETAWGSALAQGASLKTRPFLGNPDCDEGCEVGRLTRYTRLQARRERLKPGSEQVQTAVSKRCAEEATWCKRRQPP